MKVFVFDSSKCNGCYGCQLACKDEHWNNDWMPYSKPQPDTGQFWCKMEQVDHGQTPKVRVEYWPYFGGQNPEIAEYAPEVLMDREDGLQVIMPEKAQGRKDIADKFEGVYWNEELQIPQACNGCAHLVDEGELPHCADVCATGALRFGDYEEFASELAESGYEFKNEGEGTLGGRVYYVNMPHLFIGGEVWDPATDEVVEGAKVTLSGNVDMVTESDEFGDFWFRRIDAGNYTVTVEAEGYETATKEVVLEKSLNIGDFPLVRIAGNEAEAPVGKVAPIDMGAPVDVPDVEVAELGDVTAAFSVMSQAETEGGGLMDDSGIAKN